MACKNIDLSGRTYGKWTAIGPAEDKIDKNGKRYRMWEVECSCVQKTRRHVQERHLKSGQSISCGCGRKKDLTGHIFGRLTALEIESRDERGRLSWHCECSCEDRTRLVVKSWYLTSGFVADCGCVRERRREDELARLEWEKIERVDQQAKELDLTGRVFDRLIVLGPGTPHPESGIKRWLCECTCTARTRTHVTRNSLTSNGTRSCGCRHRERVRSVSIIDSKGRRRTLAKIMRRKFEKNWKNVAIDLMYERDRGLCGFCGETIDRSLHSSDDMGLSIDHVIPLTDGGTNDADNLRISHRKCNMVGYHSTVEHSPAELKLA